MKKRRGYVEIEDIFEALGLPDAAELRAQTLLGVEVCKRIRALKATQKETATRLGITQPQVSELKRGKFDLPEPVSQAGDIYRDRLDTVRGFLNEACVIELDGWTPRAALYKEYRRWATDSGRLPVSATNFNDHLRSNLGTSIEERTRRGTRGWGGITLADVA